MRRVADQMGAAKGELNTQLLSDVETELKRRGISDDEMVALRVSIKFAHARNPRKTAKEITDMIADFSSAADTKDSLNEKGASTLLTETQEDWDRLKGRR